MCAVCVRVRRALFDARGGPRAVFVWCVCVLSRRESRRCRRGAAGSQGLPSGGAGQGLAAWTPEAWTGAPPGQQGPPEKAAGRGRGSGDRREPWAAGSRGNPEEGCLRGLMSGLAEFC